MRRSIYYALLSFIVPLLILSGWLCLHWRIGGEFSYITDPKMVLAKAWSIRGELAANSLLSLKRLVLGVAAGATFGVATGITLGRSRVARLLLGPTLNALIAVPIIVFIPFFFMIFGFGELFRISVVAALAFLLVHQAMFSAVRAFNMEWLELAAHRQKTAWQVASEMLIPASLPGLIHALRLSLLFGWLAIAFSEKAVAQWPNGGLGYQLLRAKEQGLWDELFATAITLGVVAWILDALIRWVERHVTHWRPTVEGEQ